MALPTIAIVGVPTLVNQHYLTVLRGTYFYRRRR